jgi:hypothetical protein
VIRDPSRRGRERQKDQIHGHTETIDLIRRLYRQLLSGPQHINKPTSKLPPRLLYAVCCLPPVRPTSMPNAPRPLPGAPSRPPFAGSADVHSYRPLPTPPLQSVDCRETFFVKGLNLQTPTQKISLASASSPPHVSPPLSTTLSASSELLSIPRPRLHVSVTPPTPRKSSLDSLTVRSPALCDTGQALSPVVGRRNNPMAYDPGCPRRAPKRSSRLSSAHSDFSPLVFTGQSVITESDTQESEDDGGKFTLACTASGPHLIPSARTRSSPSHPTTEERHLRTSCYSTTTLATTSPNNQGSHRDQLSCLHPRGLG